MSEKTYRVVGRLTVEFTVKLEAANAADAKEQVECMGASLLDYADSEELDIDECWEVST